MLIFLAGVMVMLYFAYGSNLLCRRLSERTPSARVVGTALLQGHSLRFHKIGTDGSGKCDAFETGSPGDLIHGVLYTLEPDDRKVLDAIEGVGGGYEVSHVTVQAGTPKNAFTYVAQHGYIDPGMEPFCWYRNFVLAGALEHGFPKSYVDNIRSITFKQDPDSDRRARNDRVLALSDISMPRGESS